KTRILDEFSANTGFSRKYAIRVLNTGYKAGKKKPGPRQKYGSDKEFCLVLRRMWKLLNYPCGKILKPQLPVLIPFYERYTGYISAGAKEKLCMVSPATLDRILKHYKKRGESTTTPGSLLRTRIPVQGCQWDEKVP